MKQAEARDMLQGRCNVTVAKQLMWPHLSYHGSTRQCS